MKIGITGVTGRMGRSIARSVIASGFTLSAAHSRSNVGEDVGDVIGLHKLNVKIDSDIKNALKQSEVVIDFTRPAFTSQLLEVAVAQAIPLVIGTTGLESHDIANLKEAAKKIPIVYSANTSIGVNVLMDLVEKAAKALGEGFDIEIFEMHHRNKVDAPSGTALMLGEAAAAGLGGELKDLRLKPHDGITGIRPQGKIGFAVARGGGVIGEHSVIFASDEERVEITHKAASREVFASGAVKAAAWVQNKRKPGLYSMKDVLGL
jgi:4-hydroxy-tetrahydrodipicolinate reductase